jgi:hypothetical protein
VAITGTIAVGKTAVARQLGEQLGCPTLLDQAPHGRSRHIADAAPRALVREMELSQERARVLDPARWRQDAQLYARLEPSGVAGDIPANYAPAVSDFWFLQSRAMAMVWFILAFGEFRRWQGDYEDLCHFLVQQRTKVVRPKLIICLSVPTEMLMERIPTRATTWGLEVDREMVELSSAAVDLIVPLLGMDTPRLRLDATDVSDAVSQAAAAIEGMKPLEAEPL